MTRPAPNAAQEAEPLSLAGLLMAGASQTPKLVLLSADSIVDHLALVEADASELGLEHTANRIKHTRVYLQKQTRIDFLGDVQLKHDIRVLREALVDDLNKRKIFFPNLEKFGRYYEKSFGQEVWDAFPDARREIMDAGNSYVTDDDTGCVFHCMRVAEFGLRALAKRLLPRMRPEKLQWGPIIRELRAKIEALHKPGKRPLTRTRKELLEFYNAAIDQCGYFKTIRDDVAHTQGYCESGDALKALTHVEEFMRLLAKNGLKLPRTLPT
jgi:hypothetical protein